MPPRDLWIYRNGIVQPPLLLRLDPKQTKSWDGLCLIALDSGDFITRLDFLQQCNRLLANAPRGGVKKLYKANGREKVHNLVDALRVSY